VLTFEFLNGPLALIHWRRRLLASTASTKRGKNQWLPLDSSPPQSSHPQQPPTYWLRVQRHGCNSFIIN